MGRSRGGLTTKIHALVDAEGRPVDLVLTAGQTHDGKPTIDMLEVLQPDTILLADRAYDSDAIRSIAAQCTALNWTVIASNNALSSPFENGLKAEEGSRSGIGSDDERPQKRRNDEGSFSASANLRSERSS